MKVLLDMSFILLTLGVDTDKEALKGLKRLAEIKAEVCYSCVSILESLWITARLSRVVDFDVERFRHGLRSIIESGKYAKVEENSDIFNDALRLHMLGHKDMIDNILYASSIHLNLKLLTLDIELKKRAKIAYKIAEVTGMSSRWVMKYLPAKLKERPGLGGPSRALKPDKRKEKTQKSKVAHLATEEYKLLLLDQQHKILTVKNYANTRFVNIVLEKPFYTRIEKIAENLSTTPDTIINNTLLLTLKTLENMTRQN